MAKAHVIPIEADDVSAPQVIKITGAGVASPAARIIGAGQSVTFINNYGSPVDIQFDPNSIAPTTVFNDIIGLSPANSNTQKPQVANGSVNYYVKVGSGPAQGPYAIQVGAGPLYIQVSYNPASGKALVNPNPAMIPCKGTLEMVSTDYNYDVAWTTGDPFAPALTSVGVSNNTPHQESKGAIGDHAYTVTKYGTSQNTRGGVTAAGGGGGGTVKVKSS